MGLVFRLEDYAHYREAVGEATYIDLTRRSDPARSPRAWDNLRAVVETYGAPWIVQIWTKDPAGVLRMGDDLPAALREAGTTLTAQVTITGLAGTPWEPLVPGGAMADIPALAAALGGIEHITWRYDPIIPTVHRTERFEQLAQQAADMGLSRGVINFISPPGRYVRVDRRLAPMLPSWAEDMPGYDDAWRQTVAGELVERAEAAGIALACCAERAGLAEAGPGLGQAACGDYAWFVRLSGRRPVEAASQGSRRGCSCARYFDVGAYGQWRRCHRCAYCYAG